MWWAISISILSFALGFGLRALRIARVALFLLLFVIGMGVGYAAKADPEPENWKWILIPLLAGIGAGFLAGLYWHTRRVKGAFLKRVEYFAKKVMEDFRIAAVFVGLLVSIALTFYFARLATDESVKGFWTEFYAAWVAGLLFFAVVGLILGLVSLYRPERDVFAARVKILTGGKEGSAIDYIANELKQIGFIAQNTVREITIGDYDPTHKAFRVNVKHSSTISNIYDDVPTAASGVVRVTPDPFDAALKVVGEFTAFRLNGTSQEGIPFEYGLNGALREWKLEIPGGGRGKLDFEYWGWYLDTAEHEYAPVRFTQEMIVKFRARCRNPSKRLLLKLTTPSQTEDHVLGWDGEFDILPLKDLAPGKIAYKFRLGFEA